jgi:hypothetical protein
LPAGGPLRAGLAGGALASLLTGGALASLLAGAAPAPALAAGSASTPACTGVVAGVTVSAGDDQVAKVGMAFSQSLEVAVVDTAGCGVANADVAFTAPPSGASAYFAGETTTATVATSSNGVATAPALTANDVSGSFTLVAEVDGFEADFTLTNTTVGVAASVTVVSGNGQSVQPGATFASPLVVSVTDSSGDPVAGATVAFAVQPGSSGASATFVGGGGSTTEQTDESGRATSPELTAGSTSGPFTVVATVSGISTPATFTLSVGAGPPEVVNAGAGTSQSTVVGTDFPVPLAVTVTDSGGNDVEGAPVTFRAPAAGASGVFAGAGRSVTVTTNSDGVATAPAFSANGRVGGYVVTATVAGVSSPATFALVNKPRTSASAAGPAGSYWLATSTGRVLASGEAAALGSVPAGKLGGSKVVAMASVPGGKGYWLVTAKGAVYAFGGAKVYGSPAGSHLAKPVVGIASTPDGKGYWLVASDGASSTTATHASTARRQAPTSLSRSSALPPPPTARATGWSPRTGASSTTATHASTARPPRAVSSSRSSASQRHRRAMGTGWWHPTAACSPSVRPPTTALASASRPSRSWAWCRAPTVPATGS